MQTWDDSLYIDQLENDHLARSQLRREPTTESLEKLVRNTIILKNSPNSKQRVIKVPRKNQLPRLPRLSKTLIGIKPQHVKDEEEETRKIFRERTFWIRQQRQLKRNQSSSSHHRSLSTPSQHFSTTRTLDSISPSGCVPKPLTKKQLNLLKDQIHSFKHAFSRPHGDLPSPKSDDWFRDQDLSSALDVVLQVEDHNLPSDLPLAKKPLALLEKGVDRLGRKLGSFQRRTTCPHTPSPASPSAPPPTQLQPVSPNMATQSSQESSSSPLTSINLDSSCSSSSDTSRCKTPLSSPGFSNNFPNLVLTASPDDVRTLHNYSFQIKGKLIDVPDVISENDEPVSCQQEEFHTPPLALCAHSPNLLRPKPSPRLNSQSPPSSLRPLCPLSIVTKDLPMSDSSSKSSRSAASTPSFCPRKSSSHSAPARGPSARHHSQSLVSLLYGQASTDSVCIRGNRSNRRPSMHTIGLLPPPIPPVPFSPHQPRRPSRASKRRASSTDIEACHLTKDVSEHVLSQLAVPGTLLETDVLLQQQGGLSFFGQEKFNERFRSKPWQTIKTLRQYDRPGEWDAEYVPGPGCVKLVQTPHSPETYPLPTSEWTWVTDFVVDTHSRPVDEDGWEYYDLFTQQWRPFRHGLRTFVRRRRWLRVRAKVNNLAGSAEGVVGQGIGSSSGVVADAGEGPATSTVPIVVLKKLGRRSQSLKIVSSHQAPSIPSLVTHRSDSVVAPFELVWDEDGLDCHNPFFCTNTVVEEICRFLSRPDQTELQKMVGWDGCQVDGEVKEKWLDGLAKINLDRAAKVLIELSEHQKIKLWRYWFGVDTYENNSSGEGDSRPSPEDLWRVIDRYLDLILDQFVYQHTRFKFLYLVSGVYPDSSLRLKPPSSRPRLLTVPDCMNPDSLPGSQTSSSTTSMQQHSGGSFADLSGRARIGFWNDVVRLLSEFEWNLGESVEWKKKVGCEIRKELSGMVKGHYQNLRKGRGTSGNHKAVTL